MTIYWSTTRHWRKLATAIAALALALALIGLEQGSAGAAARKGAKVGIDHFAFQPGTLRIAKGTRVTFENESGVAHTATRNGSFDTGRIAPGKSAVVRFNHTGTFAYHCTIHPFMHGKIVVH
jgi:plastocyanin